MTTLRILQNSTEDLVNLIPNDDDRTRLEILQRDHYVFASIVTVLAFSVAAFGCSISPHSQTLVAWFDANVGSTALSWISSHIGFTHTIDWLRAHVDIKFVSSLISVFLAAGTLGCLGLAALSVVGGMCLKARKHYPFVFFLSCINCLCGPLGIWIGIRTIDSLRRPAVMSSFVLSAPGAQPEANPGKQKGIQEGVLLEVIRMPNPVHVGLVLTHYGSDHGEQQRSVWINGWFGISLPISIKAIVTSHSPYFLPFLPTAGPYIISSSTAERIEKMARALELKLKEENRPYSFVPGVFDGIWPLFQAGGHTSNNVVASLLHLSGVLGSLESQTGPVAPWLLAPGANPNKARNIMPADWFETTVLQR